MHNRLDCIKLLYDKLNASYSMSLDENEIDKIDFAFSDMYTQYKSYVAHYFRTIYVITNFIEISDVEGKMLYIDLFRSQLSSHELILIFYYDLSPLSEENFHSLIEEFALLVDIDKSKILNQDEHLKFYSRNTLGLSKE